MSLLEPNYPNKSSLYFMDGVVEYLRTYLGTNLSWLDYNYGEQFTFTQEVNGARVLVPNVYIGQDRYLQTTIDNKKQGTCFFIVGESSATNYRTNLVNFYETSVSIVFQANMSLIDGNIDEYFREELISEVIYHLRTPRGTYFQIDQLEVIRDLNDVFIEFGYDVREVYKYPMTAFRINLNILHQAECLLPTPRTECDILWDSITSDELINCIIPRINFCDEDYRNAISQESLECILDNNMLNLYPQENYTIGDISGSFTLNWNTDYSFQSGTLTGNITDFNIANFPSNKNVYFELELTQGGSGDYGIDFSGSGVYFVNGLTSDDMQPRQGNGETTTYSIKWQNNKLLVIKAEYSDAQ